MGDAAHAPLPTSGQRACQALEDAWHLVRVLEKYDDLLVRWLFVRLFSYLQVMVNNPLSLAVYNCRLYNC